MVCDKMNEIRNKLSLILIVCCLKMPFSSSLSWKWNKDVSDLIERVANDNNLDLKGARKFSKCHIVPLKFITDMVDKYKSSEAGAPSGKQMRQFVQDITMAHIDAAYYQKLEMQTKEDYDNLTAKYQAEALSKLHELNNAILPTKVKGVKGKLLKLLFSSPGNIFPGYKRTEGATGQCQDFPRKGKYVRNQVQRTDQMISHVLNMQKRYAKFGLKLFKTSKDVRKQPASYRQGNKKPEIKQANLENGCSQNSSLPGCRASTDRLMKINLLKRLSRMFVLKQRRKLKYNTLTANDGPLARHALEVEHRHRIPRDQRNFKLKSGQIDFTGSWIPKHKKEHVGGRKTSSSVDVSSGHIKVLSGGYHGKAESGYLSAKGSLQVGSELSAKDGTLKAKIHGPSAEASAHGIGVSGDLSAAVSGTFKEDYTKIGVHGPGVKVNVGPFGVGFRVGAGVEASTNVEKGVGGKVITPKGSFGAKIGCITEACFFGCITLKFC